MRGAGFDQNSLNDETHLDYFRYYCIELSTSLYSPSLQNEQDAVEVRAGENLAKFDSSGLTSSDCTCRN